MKKSKVIIFQGQIPQYRVPIFNEIAKKYELLVVYSDGNTPKNIEFEVKKVSSFIFKSFIFLKTNIFRLVKEADAIITMLDSSYIPTQLLSRTKHRKKTILWGIGVAASYSSRFDSDPRTVLVYSKYIKRVEAALFYSEYPVKKYIENGVLEDKLFVANNTVEVLPVEKVERKNILFIGTLYKAKKIFELLNSYEKAFTENSNVPKLVVVGDGSEKDNIEKWIKENKLQNNIVLTGAIFEETKLSKIFAESIACISPDQAGLSVLKSFGYGVPFITHKNSITGGERLNIIDGNNGVFFDDFDEITNIILDITRNPKKYVTMGENALSYYNSKRTVSNMVSGFCDAIEYVKNKNLK